MFSKEIPDGPTRIVKRSFVYDDGSSGSVITVERKHFKLDAIGEPVWLRSEIMIALAKTDADIGGLSLNCLIYDLAAEVIRLSEQNAELEKTVVELGKPYAGS